MSKKFRFISMSQLILKIRAVHSAIHLSSIKCSTFKMIRTINKTLDISMLMAVTVGSLCPACSFFHTIKRSGRPIYRTSFRVILHLKPYNSWIPHSSVTRTVTFLHHACIMEPSALSPEMDDDFGELFTVPLEGCERRVDENHGPQSCDSLRPAPSVRIWYSWEPFQRLL